MRASDEIVRLLFVLFLGVGWPAKARAENGAQRFSLGWTRLPGAERCLSARALSRAVETRLARPVFGAPSESDVGVEGHVEPSGTGFHAVVSLVNTEGVVLGTREVSSAEPSCRDLDAPLAVIVALFVDPNATSNTAELPPAAQEPAAPPPEPRKAAIAEKKVPAMKPVPPRTEPWKSWAALGGGAALGVLPAPAPALVLGVGLVPPGGWPVLLRGALVHEEVRGTSGSADPIAFSLASAALDACPLHGEWTDGALRACAGMNIGVLSTRGLSDGAILVRHRASVAVDARAEGALHLGEHAFIQAGITLAVPLLRDYFDFEQGAERTLVYRQAPVGASIDVALGIRVP